MEYIIGIILLISFFGLAYYCIKGHNLMIGFLLITLLWTILPLGGTLFVSESFLASNPILQFGKDNTLIAALNKIYQSAPEGWGTTLVNVCWGAWFGRVLMDTGIASTLIRKTVELGGDKPFVTVALLNVVTALIFYCHDRSRPGYCNRCYRTSDSYVSGYSKICSSVYIYGISCSRYLY